MLEVTWEQLGESEEELRRRTRAWMERHAAAGEQLLVQLLYVYLCGAVYDRQIESKAALAVSVVSWIFLISAGNAMGASVQEEKSLLTEAAWRMARCIEHNDEILERLENALHS